MVMLLQGPKFGIVTLDRDYNILSNTLPEESANYRCEYYALTHRFNNSNVGEFLLTSKYCAGTDDSYIKNLIHSENLYV